MGQQVMTSSGRIKGAAPWLFKKVTTKTVSGTVAATDLLNGELTLPPMSATNIVRVKAWGTSNNGSGAAQTSLRWQVVLGGSTLIDTGVAGANTIAIGAGDYPWNFDITIENMNATNSQTAFWKLFHQHLTGAQTAWVPTTGIGGISFGAVVNNAGYAHTYSDIWTTSAIDTSTAKALVVNIINPSNNASFNTVLRGATVEVL